MTKVNDFVYKVIPAGIFDANCTIVGHPKTGNYVLCDVSGSSEQIVAEAKGLGLTKCVGVFFTHGHFDHIGDATKIKQLTGAPLYMNQADQKLYGDVKRQCKAFGVPVVSELVPIDVFVKEDDIIAIDDMKGRVIHTPGHSPGSACLYFEELDLLINGDTLFRGSMGRTDLWGGSYEQIEDSIKNKLFKLPERTVVITGHGADTTIGYEKRNNMINY
ncbi:beta lactamase domain, putative [Entamoeba invadens IP1]|uniref:Beta lactamase domain, putative n=1 Tax=Entamoeba invadens IP1 TaxID=370355 RepID=A0A0A1U9I9_ENTIV|nr:beta lactamase domain, putative [Entamoeba invadens IP1]ELP91651.1 beta lactamase domain, putative [Entamoeba invadens IP1]|eukprot:XP_004258422.1 beta lactamase domain, putative [Entamoeba invadens IP1]